MSKRKCPYCGYENDEIVEDGIYCLRCRLDMKSIETQAMIKTVSVTCHPALVEKALNWQGSTRDFCREVLKLDRRISNALERNNFHPVGVLHVSWEPHSVRGMDKMSFEILNKARKDWKSE